jgi:glycosyltransferase involved in cell wall biosynthesis
MSVSVALIVKNEEFILGRCLESLRNAVDEIIVTDTGSEDATKEVAKRYTDKVYDFKWCDDFSAARQFSTDHATGDWVVWVDADDVVLDAENIRRLTDGARPDICGFDWLYVYERDTWGNSLCETWRTRCVRREGPFRWVGRIHEDLLPLEPCTVVRSTEVIVEHHFESHKVAGKAQRNLNILEEQYTAPALPPSPRTLFYLARQYAGIREYDKALEVFKQFLLVADWDDNYYLALTHVANLYRRLKTYGKAIEADLRALEVCPRWPDAYFGLAKTYYSLRDWHAVIHWAEIGRSMELPETRAIINPMDYHYNWLIYYAYALHQVGRSVEALDWTRRAISIRPDDPRHQLNLTLFSRPGPEE